MMKKVEQDGDMVLRLHHGECLITELQGQGIHRAFLLAGIGMVRDLELGFFQKQNYKVQKVEGPCELLSLQGNLSRGKEGMPHLHCHVVVQEESGMITGGHLLKGTVCYMVEIYGRRLPGIRMERIEESPGLWGLDLERE